MPSSCARPGVDKDGALQVQFTPPADGSFPTSGAPETNCRVNAPGGLPGVHTHITANFSDAIRVCEHFGMHVCSKSEGEVCTTDYEDACDNWENAERATVPLHEYWFFNGTHNHTHYW